MASEPIRNVPNVHAKAREHRFGGRVSKLGDGEALPLNFGAHFHGGGAHIISVTKDSAERLGSAVRFLHAARLAHVLGVPTIELGDPGRRTEQPGDGLSIGALPTGGADAADFLIEGAKPRIESVWGTDQLAIIDVPFVAHFLQRRGPGGDLATRLAQR